MLLIYFTAEATFGVLPYSAEIEVFMSQMSQSLSHESNFKIENSAALINR